MLGVLLLSLKGQLPVQELFLRPPFLCWLLEVAERNVTWPSPGSPLSHLLAVAEQIERWLQCAAVRGWGLVAVAQGLRPAWQEDLLVARQVASHS